jgi:hypothetical protein
VSVIKSHQSSPYSKYSAATYSPAGFPLPAPTGDSYIGGGGYTTPESAPVTKDRNEFHPALFAAPMLHMYQPPPGGRTLFPDSA